MSSKCPNCGNPDFECVDEEFEYPDDEHCIIRFLDYCPKCNYQFDLVAAYDLKEAHWENIELMLEE